MENSTNTCIRKTFLLYINTRETRCAFAQKHDIFARENNMLSSHVKRSPLLWLHNKLCLSQQKAIKMKWYFIGVYIINKTLHGYSEIQNFLFSC